MPAELDPDKDLGVVEGKLAPLAVALLLVRRRKQVVHQVYPGSEHGQVALPTNICCCTNGGSSPSIGTPSNNPLLNSLTLF